MDIQKIEEIRSNVSNDPLIKLKRALITYDRELAKNTLEDIIRQKIDPLMALSSMTGVMKLIGDAFEREELFLPDLVGSGETMLSVMPILQDEIKKAGKEKRNLGKVILGTVRGDVHSIGKTMVGTLLTANGFEVFDLGVDVSAGKFLEAIKKYDPDIIAMSALLTTTALEQKIIIDTLSKEGLRKHIKVMVGGGAITEEFAMDIGADGYESTAPAAVGLAKKLLQIE